MNKFILLAAFVVIGFACVASANRHHHNKHDDEGFELDHDHDHHDHEDEEHPLKHKFEHFHKFNKFKHHHHPVHHHGHHDHHDHEDHCNHCNQHEHEHEYDDIHHPTSHPHPHQFKHKHHHKKPHHPKQDTHKFKYHFKHPKHHDTNLHKHPKHKVHFKFPKHPHNKHHLKHPKHKHHDKGHRASGKFGQIGAEEDSLKHRGSETHLGSDVDVDHKEGVVFNGKGGFGGERHTDKKVEAEGFDKHQSIDKDQTVINNKVHGTNDVKGFKVGGEVEEDEKFGGGFEGTAAAGSEDSVHFGKDFDHKQSATDAHRKKGKASVGSFESSK